MNDDILVNVINSVKCTYRKIGSVKVGIYRYDRKQFRVLLAF